MDIEAGESRSLCPVRLSPDIAASMVRRLLRVLGGRPAAARRASSACAGLGGEDALVADGEQAGDPQRGGQAHSTSEQTAAHDQQTAELSARGSAWWCRAHGRGCSAARFPGDAYFGASNGLL